MSIYHLHSISNSNLNGTWAFLDDGGNLTLSGRDWAAPIQRLEFCNTSWCIPNHIWFPNIFLNFINKNNNNINKLYATLLLDNI